MARLFKTLFLVLVTIGALSAVFGVIAVVGLARLTADNTPAGAPATAAPAAANATNAPANAPSNAVNAVNAVVPALPPTPKPAFSAAALPPAGAATAGGAGAWPPKHAAHAAVIAHDPAADRIVLSAADARLRGTIFRREDDTHDVVGWTRAGDSLDWTVENAAGQVRPYHVDLTYACAAGQGGDFTVRAAEQALPGHAEPTGSASNFRTLRLGLLHLPGGRSRVALKPAAGLQHDLMRLRQIELVPARPGDPADLAPVTLAAAPAPLVPAAPPVSPPAAPPAAPPVAAPAAGAMASFTLIDTTPNKPISPLTDGMTLDLSVLPAKHLSIRADVDGSPGSVRFGLDRKERLHVENSAPYAINADDHGKLIPWEFPVGEHTVTATPFTGKDATGQAGKALSVHFKVVPGDSHTNPIVLKAEEAKLQGKDIRIEDQAGYHDIGYWQTADQTARWEVKPARAGKYQVRLSYAADNGSGGGDYEVKVGGQKLTGHAAGTGGWQEYRTVDLGVVSLPADKVTLTVKPTNLQNGKALMNLKQLEFTPQ